MTTATTTIETLEVEEVPTAAKNTTTEDATHAMISPRSKSIELEGAAQLEVTLRTTHNRTKAPVPVEHCASPTTFARPRCLEASS